MTSRPLDVPRDGVTGPIGCGRRRNLIASSTKQISSAGQRSMVLDTAIGPEVHAGLAAAAPLGPLDQVSGLASQDRAEAIEGFQVHSLGQVSADAVYGYEMHP